MAFQKDETGILQTATNAAAVLVAAEVGVGELTGTDVLDRLRAVRDELFLALDEARIRDNAMFIEQEANKPAKKTSTYTRATGGGSTGGAAFKGGVEDARKLQLNFGAFKGITLAEVYAMSATEAGEYGYPKANPGSRAGKDYVKWLSTNTTTNNSDGKGNDFVAGAAQLILDGARASSDQDA